MSDNFDGRFYKCQYLRCKHMGWFDIIVENEFGKRVKAAGKMTLLHYAVMPSLYIIKFFTFIVLITAFFSLSLGYAQDTQPLTHLSAFDNVLFSKLITESYSQEGERLLCEQQPYLDCFKIHQNQCLQEQSKSRQSCLDKALKDPQNEQNTDHLSKVFAACMQDNHLKIYPLLKGVGIRLCLIGAVKKYRLSAYVRKIEAIYGVTRASTWYLSTKLSDFSHPALSKPGSSMATSLGGFSHTSVTLNAKRGASGVSHAPLNPSWGLCPQTPEVFGQG